MKICIVGAGAVGGLLGVKLLHSGHDVSFVDLPEVVSQIKQQGLSLSNIDGTTQEVSRPTISSEFVSDLPVDLVILAVKAHQIEHLASKLQTILTPATAVMTIQNGIPWWYFKLHSGAHDGRRLISLDPSGIIESHIDAERIIGCVAYPAAVCTEPGVIKHIEGNRFTIGELSGEKTDRCESISNALIQADFKSYVIDDIRAELWLKAWGALSFNTISALTGATMEQICRCPETRQLAGSMMAEAKIIANNLGIEFRHTIEKRIDGAEKVGAHKTSMLQDVEAGRRLEIEALVGSIRELATITLTPTPSIDAIYACCKLLDRPAGE